MTIAQTDEPSPSSPLRLWPGVIAVALQWLAWFVLPIVVADTALFGLLGGLAGGLVVLLWWLFLSRAPSWSDRVGPIVAAPVAVFATKYVVHDSIAGAGMGMSLYFYAFPRASPWSLRQ